MDDLLVSPLPAHPPPAVVAAAASPLPWALVSIELTEQHPADELAVFFRPSLSLTCFITSAVSLKQTKKEVRNRPAHKQKSVRDQ